MDLPKLTSLQPASFAALSPKALSVLKPTYLTQLPRHLVEVLSAEVISEMPCTLIEAFSPVQRQWLSASAYAALVQVRIFSKYAIYFSKLTGRFSPNDYRLNKIARE